MNKYNKKREERRQRWLQYKKLKRQQSYEMIQKVTSIKRINTNNNIETIKKDCENIIKSLHNEINTLKNTQNILSSSNERYKQYYLLTYENFASSNSLSVGQESILDDEIMSLHETDDLDNFVSTQMEIPLSRRRISIEAELEMELHL